MISLQHLFSFATFNNEFKMTHINSTTAYLVFNGKKIVKSYFYVNNQVGDHQ
jgi:hypothetical protein